MLIPDGTFAYSIFRFDYSIFIFAISIFVFDYSIFEKNGEGCEG